MTIQAIEIEYVFVLLCLAKRCILNLFLYFFNNGNLNKLINIFFILSSNYIIFLILYFKRHLKYYKLRYLFLIMLQKNLDLLI